MLAKPSYTTNVVNRARARVFVNLPVINHAIKHESLQHERKKTQFKIKELVSRCNCLFLFYVQIKCLWFGILIKFI